LYYFLSHYPRLVRLPPARPREILNTNHHVSRATSRYAGDYGAAEEDLRPAGQVTRDYVLLQPPLPTLQVHLLILHLDREMLV